MLIIANCPELNAVPISIRQLNNLGWLNIYHCPISELNLGVASLSFFLSNLKRIELDSTDLCRISFSEDNFPLLESLTVSNNNHIKEIEELPRSLKTISLKDCEMLKSIPSLAEFTSLTEFSVTGNCSGIQKIEGLENCTTLKSLILESCLEAPGIESLEYMHNLKWLIVEANKRSLIERCNQRMQISPDEIRICARAVPDAASLLHSLLTPLLVMEDHFFSQEKLEKNRRELSVSSNVTDDSCVYCFLLNCVSAKIQLGHGYYHVTKVGKGRWALVAVVPLKETIGGITLIAEFGGGFGRERERANSRGDNSQDDASFRKLMLLRGTNLRLF